ncbi:MULTISPECIES: hypothetical protein [unclassified Pseudovibrio]|uniref:hypothetical protein n=1 Tax=unclassified Pseudovibrio TaxID=2627060 RepID=UPI0007AEE078|nr:MULTISPECIES: hypothetical protein [unclassified Pseudovibrio]KZL03246.1 hypothetical protein PsW74_00671 [Pseudovibrio sp. W74]KZL12300.1 hypothetical protein PsAD14_00468 [Pseudovibrio sp. Ad14]
MISRASLTGAISAGIISADQADKLVSYLSLQAENIQNQQASECLHDPEEVRFTRGFHDIFISLGILILFAGYGIGFGDSLTQGGLPTAAVAGAAAIITWVLAEWFTKIKKLALPSILLTGLFGGSIALVGFGLFTPDVLNNDSEAIQVILSSIFALVGASLFYWRFKVPITLTVIVAGIMGLIVGALTLVTDTKILDYLSWVSLVCGLFAFGCAMYFDTKDTKRETLNTDKAFWLHLLAAPLIVHSILSGMYFEQQTEAYALVSIAVVLAFGAVALIIDRRAMLVAALSYLGFALAYLLESADFSASQLTAISLVLLGSFVLLLGSGWNVARRIVMRPLAGTTLTTYLPPIRN